MRQILLPIAFFCFISGAQSQSKLDQVLQFPRTTIRLDTLLQRVTYQAGIKFSYNSKRIKMSSPIRLSAKRCTVKQVLDQLAIQTNTQYTLINNQVVLHFEKTTEPTPSATRKKQLLPVTESKDTIRAVIPDTVDLIANKDSIQNRKYVLVKDSLATSTTRDTIDAQPLLPNRISSIPLDTSSAAVIPVKGSDRTSSTVNKLFIDVGVSAEETLFAGVTIRAGIPAIYGLISTRTTQESMAVILGAGTTFKFAKSSTLSLSAQYSQFEKIFPFHRVDSDTVEYNYDVGVKNTLFRMSADWEWKLSNGQWFFYAGVTVNLLESRYSIDGRSSNLDALSKFDEEKEFSVVRPFYTIFNTYSSQSESSIKSWIGVQAGLRYRINFR